MSESQQQPYGRGWSSGQGTSLEELTCPSGAVCLVQKPDLAALARYGVLEKMDFLTGAVEDKVVRPATRPGSKSAGEDKIQLTSDQLIGAFSMIDVLVVSALVAPKVELAPAPNCTICGWEGGDFRDHDSSEHGPQPKPRDRSVIYTDSIDTRDKMHVFNWATRGLKDLEQFLQDTKELVETPQPGEGLGRAARRASTAKKRPTSRVVAK
jgi:hypothetical protein